jgi:tetratricopeptide (TPR) repeat protein
MMRVLFTIRVFAACAVLGISGTAHAQRIDESPRRPRLSASADTNDFQAYMDLGLAEVHNNPEKAAAAFYWASRINPASAEALYNRYTALLMLNKFALVDFTGASSSIPQRNAKMMKIDSLYLRALMIDPFLFRSLEKELDYTMIHYIAEQYVGQNASTMEIEFAIRKAQAQQGPLARAWVAYANHDLPKAVALFTEVLEHAKGQLEAGILMERGRVYATQGAVVPALADFAAAFQKLRALDSSKFVYVYDSKALMQFATGLIHERNGDLDSAVAAYGRSIQEDLSFYPSHVRLGLLAMHRADTTTALSELQLASQLGANDPTTHFVYAYTLGTTNRNDEAVAELQKAEAVDPFFARPYVLLGDIFQAAGKDAEALAQYRAFLAHASRSDRMRPVVEQSVASLTPHD